MPRALIDRSGVDDDTEVVMGDGEVYVCTAGSCRAQGAEALVAEIEELADAVGGCTVRRTGCLGYCSQAPNVACRNRVTGNMEFETKVTSIEQSAKVVQQATGRIPTLHDPAVAVRFAALRAKRAREEARRVYHWNAALRGIEQAFEEQSDLCDEFKTLLADAGFAHGIQTSISHAPLGYTQWTMESITPVSAHSAVFSLTCKDRKRGTPHPRGRGQKPELKTWHTTMLAEVGPNAEGPLPWVEREYTPISSAKDWESGRCDLLVKVYASGKATWWLHRTMPKQVWLSKPVKTLSVPSLVSEGSSFAPKSVMLVLAGTGVVALSQILHHRDPIHKLGLSTHSRDQLRVPIDLVLSCREDDILMLPQIAELAAAGETKGIRHCTLLLTSANTDPPVFHDAIGPNVSAAMDALGGLANVTITRDRLNYSVMSRAVTRMARPCRAVVSGPDGFNSAARAMLEKLLDADEITILTA